MEKLACFLINKRDLAEKYMKFFKGKEELFFAEPKNCFSNYWLNAILLKNRKERNEFLTYMNDSGVMTRPIWQLMNQLPMFKNCQHGDLSNAEYFEERVVNLPSSVRM